MTEPLRTERSTSARAPSDADRQARIEQLLLSGLDRYFAGNYEGAIDIWTRVAFLERGHGRARAYIERARSALAERQRESEELLHSGVEAYNAGRLDTARELLTRSVDQGGPSDTALVFLERLSRSEAAVGGVRTDRAPEAPRETAVAAAPAPKPRGSNWTVTFLASAVLAATILMTTRPVASWLSDLPVSAPASEEVPPEPLPIVRAADIQLSKARRLYRAGELREALRALESIDMADPLREEADRLRATIQRDLLTMAGAGAPPTAQAVQQLRRGAAEAGAP